MNTLNLTLAFVTTGILGASIGACIGGLVGFYIGRNFKLIKWVVENEK